MSVVGQINGASYVGAAGKNFGQSPITAFNNSLQAQRSDAYVENGNRLSDKYVGMFVKAAQDPSSVVAKHLKK